MALQLLKSRIDRGLSLPKDVWILDSMPGPYQIDRKDGLSASVQHVFNTLSILPRVFPSSAYMINELISRGIDKPVALWLATNIVDSPFHAGMKECEFDFDVILELFKDFCEIDMWPFLDRYRGTATIHFLRAGKNKGWSGETIDRLRELERRGNNSSSNINNINKSNNNSSSSSSSSGGGGIRLHEMAHVGHWLHAEDMKGTLEMILSNSRI